MEYSPEKAGVGGSIPSLATTILSCTSSHSRSNNSSVDTKQRLQNHAISFSPFANALIAERPSNWYGLFGFKIASVRGCYYVAL